MWKNYSADYIKNNRASSISIIAGSFIAALFFSILCSLFYNFWLDDIQGTEQEEGDWHGRITGEISGEDLAVINYYANVEKAVVNEELSEDQKKVIDVYFYDKRRVYQDMSALINNLGLTEDAASYNYQLLSLYFIRIPGDNMPRMLMPAYLAVVVIVCFSLILVLHNSFAVSMNSRVRQFGILSSIGATPRQIRTCLVQEAFILAAVPVLLGILFGIAVSFGIVQGMSAFAANLVGGRRMSFGSHPVILILILLLSVFTVLISAQIPAGRLSRMTPLEAIRGTGELQLKKKKHSPFLYTMFGMEGELAGNALKAQKKALRTTSLSLTFAFLGFMVMQCFWTLTGISTNHTYFEAYQDAWDVMVTVKDTHIEDFSLTEALRGFSGVESSTVYQKAEAICLLPQEQQSEELVKLGGVETFLGDSAFFSEDFFLIPAPIVILDDESFEEFCGQIGIASRLDGTIVFNRLWDSLISNFRYPKYIPYIKDMETISVLSAAPKGEITSERKVEIPVLVSTQEYPLLREEYEKSDYPLVQFIPVSLWKEIEGQIDGTEQDMYIRILANDRTELAALNLLEDEVTQIVSQEYEIESENRMQEREDNDKMIKGYKLILGAFCVLFAMIGIAHVFSNTLGFLYQRKREFARYMSVGLNPEGIRKIFCIEALVIAGRPMLGALVMTIIAVAFMIKASYLEPMEFIKVAPVTPILVFTLTVFGFVALAYYLGGKKIFKVSLADALRDDTMM